MFWALPGIIFAPLAGRIAERQIIALGIGYRRCVLIGSLLIRRAERTYRWLLPLTSQPDIIEALPAEAL